MTIKRLLEVIGDNNIDTWNSLQPDDLFQMKPYRMPDYLNEKCLFNIMVDRRRGFWIFGLYDNYDKIMALQFSAGREGDDDFTTFVFDELFIKNLAMELSKNGELKDIVQNNEYILADLDTTIPDTFYYNDLKLNDSFWLKSQSTDMTQV